MYNVYPKSLALVFRVTGVSYVTLLCGSLNTRSDNVWEKDHIKKYESKVRHSLIFDCLSFLFTTVEIDGFKKKTEVHIYIKAGPLGAKCYLLVFFFWEPLKHRSYNYLLHNQCLFVTSSILCNNKILDMWSEKVFWITLLKVCQR